MKKFIMVLSSLVMLGSVVIALANKGALEGLFSDLTTTQGEVKAKDAALAEAEDKRAEVTEKETQSKDSRNQASAAVEGVKQGLKVVERSLEDVTAELKKIEIEQKEIDLAVTRAFPGGTVSSADELQMLLTMAKETLTEKQTRKSDLEATLASAGQSKQASVAKVKEEEKFQIERAQKLALGGLVATVIAVNKEWGFVMVNAGRQNGVDPASSLLVKRGNTRIARLRIVSLQDTSVVTDVVEESVVSGITVQPGDNVIFETNN
jgi:hypothetical protein